VKAAQNKYNGGVRTGAHDNNEKEENAMQTMQTMMRLNVKVFHRYEMSRARGGRCSLQSEIILQL